MAFGKPKYGNEGGKSIKSLKDGTTRVRIVPPIHSCVKTGKWCVQHKQHFGFATPRGDDPQKKNWNTFYCVEVFNFKTRTTDIFCPECLQIDEQKELKDTTEKSLKAKGKSEAEIAKTVEPITEWLKNHNLDSKFYINVKSPEGEFYTLKVPFKVKEQLFALIEEYRNPKTPGMKAIDAIDDGQGLWFDITRTGKGFGTTYTVKVVQEAVERDGETFMKTKLAPLTDADADAAEAACYDLMDVGIRRLPLEKVKMLVNAGSPEEIDAIFASSERSPRSERSAAPEQSPAPTTGRISVPNMVNAQAGIKTLEYIEAKANSPQDLGARAPVPAAGGIEAVDEEEAALLAQVAALQARKAAAKVAETAARQEKQAQTTVSADALVKAAEKVQDTPVTKTPAVIAEAARRGATPENVMDMSEDEFLSRFGGGKK